MFIPRNQKRSNQTQSKKKEGNKKIKALINEIEKRNIIQKIFIKCWFLEKLNRIDKYLARLIRINKVQFKISNDRRNIITKLKRKKIVMKHYE